MSQVEYIYYCSECDERYTDRQEAFECCYKAPEKWFKCSKCGAEYDDFNEAKRCCND